MELLDIAKDVGTQWEVVGIYLGLRACDIQVIKADFPLTLNKAFNMLIQWRQSMPSDKNARKVLEKALKNCNLHPLAKQIRAGKSKEKGSQPSVKEETKSDCNPHEKKIWGLNTKSLT